METITNEKEFFVTGAFVQGVIIDGKKRLIVTNIEDDTFCDGEECNDRVEKEYSL